MTIAITVGLLVTGAVYLFLKPEMMRIVLGFILLSHAANLVIMAAGGTHRREAPFGTFEDGAEVADPLPQAFVLTAIVIAFSITIFMLVLAVTGRDEDDDTSTPVDEGADHDRDHAPDAGGTGDDAGAEASAPVESSATADRQEGTP